MSNSEKEFFFIRAICAAMAAGREALKIYEAPGSDFEVEYKADHSPLTIADKVSHRIIADALLCTGIPLLSEEGQQVPYEERRKWSRFWLIDPIDGTKEFIKRNGEFTVNIALLENNSPVLGVIYVPVSRELYFGIVGRGAWRKQHAGMPDQLEELIAGAEILPVVESSGELRVLCSRSYQDARTDCFLSRLRIQHPEMKLIHRGSSLKLGMVASGEADLYPRFGTTMEWDTAAGHALLLAVGKNLFQSDQLTPLVYNKANLENPSFIAC